METGEIDMLRFYSGHDVGKAINPKMIEGQIEGGVLKGIGYALLEKLHIEDGTILNPNFTDYKIPTSVDAPKIIPIIVEERFEDGPFGARGIGEPPFIAVAPAIVNAIYNATGIRLRELPVTPERLLSAIWRR
jgi:CO/xanthine dehydrogenase Mo-binding subunit